MNIPDYYSTLGIPRFTNDPELIKKAYTSQIKFFHPDANNVPPDIAAVKTRQLIDAYNVLKNSESKYYYDYTLRSQLNIENTQNYSTAPKTSNNSQKVSRKSVSTKGTSNGKVPKSFVIFLIICILICALLVFLDSTSLSNIVNPSLFGSSSSLNSSSSSLKPETAYNGMEIKKPLDKGVAPFEITSSSNSNYYVYLKDIENNGLNDLSFYLAAGSTIEKLVPLGRYELYYACGKIWYGEKDKFGEDTSYYKGDGYLDFTEVLEDDGYYYYYGHTIELILQSNGNYDSDNINESSFPN